MVSEDKPIRNWHNQDYQKYREDYSEADDNAHRLPEQVASDDHRKDSQCRGAGGQEDRLHPSCAGFHCSSLDVQALREPEFFCVFIHNNSVTDDDAYKADDAENGSQAEIKIEDPESEEGAEQTQKAHHKSQQREGKLLEME